MVDELKYIKEKMRQMEEELKREQRVSHRYQFSNSKLVEQVRMLNN